MSEVLSKSTVYKSENARPISELSSTVRAYPLSAQPFVRDVLIGTSKPIRNFDEQCRYIRVQCEDYVTVIFDGKSHMVKLLEIYVDSPKSLTLKNHNEKAISVNFVGGL